MVFSQIKVGDELPNCSLAMLVNEGPSEVRVHPLMARKAVVIFGLVGAYVPACTRHHVPNILAGIDKLTSAGIDQVFCVAENDPWVMDAWSKQVDPRSRITFLSDGNLEFGYRTGLAFEGTGLFLGRRSRRFLIVARNLIVQRVSVETDSGQLTCTRVEDALSN